MSERYDKAVNTGAVEQVTLIEDGEDSEKSSIGLKKKLLLFAGALALAGASFGVIEGTSTHNSPLSTPDSSLQNGYANERSDVAKDFSSIPTWTQDFSQMPSGPLDSKFWTYNLGDGGSTNYRWGNDEDEYYTKSPSNVSIKNGLLTITARKESTHGFEYTSARIKTESKIDFEYGKLDIVAKLPRGVGTWPAIWLLPQNDIYYYRSSAKDPLRYMNDGEIDIMEAVGAQPGQITSSAQSRKYNPTLNDERIAVDTIANDTTTFHDFGLEWTPYQLIFTVDGKAYHTVDRSPTDTYKVWPYDQLYYLIINDAVGGVWGGIDREGYPPNGVNNTALPASFDVKSITYYKYIGPKLKK